MRRLAMAILGVLVLSPAAAEEIVGRPRVIDGNTLEIDGRRISLSGIDASDDFNARCHWKGREVNAATLAKERLEQQIAQWGDGTVSCWTGGVPLYEREGLVLAVCYTEGGCAADPEDRVLPVETPAYLRPCKPTRVNLSSSMVFRGYAISSADALSGENAEYMIVESDARRNRRGLWTSDCFIFSKDYPFPRID